MVTAAAPFNNSLTIFLSFLKNWNICCFQNWRSGESDSVTDWSGCLYIGTYFPGENKLVEFLVIFHQIHSYSISRLPWRHLKCDRRTICNDFYRRVMCSLLICLYSWFCSFQTEDQPYFVQLLHSYYSRACTLQQNGEIPLLCDWMVQHCPLMVKCRKCSDYHPNA